MAKKPSDTTPKVRMRLVPRDVAKALAKSSAALDSAQLLNSLIRCWGGPDRFASDLFQEYQFAKPGTLAKQRFLEMVTRLTVQVTSQEVGKPKPVADMTHEELLATAKHLLERLNGPGTAGPTPEEA